MLYNFLYYFSLVYLAIAALCCLAAWIVIFCDLKHFFKDQLNTLPVQNPVVRFIIAILAPTIFGLGWIFFVPYLSFRKKESK